MKYIILPLSLLLATSAFAIGKKHDQFSEHKNTTVTYQVSDTKQIQQDEIQASLHVEKTSESSQEVQANINEAMKSAIELSKKYPQIESSTGRYYVYKDDQKSTWKGSQSIQLVGADQNSIAELSGELQKNGFVMENYSYFLSQKSRSSLDDTMRLELLAKAEQVAKNVFAKGLHKKFLRFAQIDFNSQNYSPVFNVRSFAMVSGSNSDAASSPIAKAGQSDVQMTANITAIFGDE